MLRKECLRDINTYALRYGELCALELFGRKPLAMQQLYAAISP